MTKMTNMTPSRVGGIHEVNGQVAPDPLSLSLMSSMSPKTQNTSLHWYEKTDVQEALIKQCDYSREVAISFNRHQEDGYFARNLHVKDRESLREILSRAGSIYCSVERFKEPSNPETRIGWDFVIDLDGSVSNETEWIVAKHFRDVILPQFKIAHYKMKFSGRRGIHIIIPEEAFRFCFSEQDFQKGYPLVPKQVAMFFDAMIYPEAKTNCKIDLSLYIQHRLLRCAYSLHDETGLVSVPVWPENLERFNPKRDSDPAIVEVDETWSNCKPTLGEASFLLDRVAEWIANKPKPKPFVKGMSQQGSRQGHIMPCIQTFLRSGFKKGMEGQRNLVLFNIVQATKRFNLAIDSNSLLEANARSQSPLPEREVREMMRYHFETRANQSYFFRTEVMRDAGLCPNGGCALCGRRGNSENGRFSR